MVGLLTAVHKDYFRVIDHREFLFNDFGDRVALLLHVQLLIGGQQVLIVNTHLLFPHDSSMCLERLRQVNMLSFFSLSLSFIAAVLSSDDMKNHRFTRSCNLLKLIRRKTILVLCPLFSVGKSLTQLFYSRPVSVVELSTC